MWFPRAKSDKNSGAWSDLHFSSVHHSSWPWKAHSGSPQAVPGSCLPRNTTQRRDTVMFPYGAWPWSRKIINPMAACSSLWLPLPWPKKKQDVDTYLWVSQSWDSCQIEFLEIDKNVYNWSIELLRWLSVSKGNLVKNPGQAKVLVL